MEEIKQYHTSLAKTADAYETLKWKRDTLEAEGRLSEEALADYIALAVTEVDGQLYQLKAVKQEIADRERWLKAQKENILKGAAHFIEDQGVDRLEGNIVSSVTVTPPKAATTKKKFVLKVTKGEMEKFLVEMDLAKYEEVEVPETAAKVRINKRKAGSVSVETES